MAKPQAHVSFLPQRTAAQKQPQQVVIYQKEFHQDVSVITLRAETDGANKYRSGQPVALWWGWSLQGGEWFYGYINHTEPNIVHGQANMLDVYCVGSVWPMRLTSQRSWRNIHSEVVVEQMAGEHRLSCLVKPDPDTLPLVAQAGKSDWSTLVMLAKRRGYTFYAHNTDLVYLPRMTVPDARVPLFTKYPNNVITARAAIVCFNRVLGETVPGQGVKASRIQYVVTDNADVQSVQVDAPQSDLAGSTTSDPLFSLVESNRPVHTVEEATTNLNGVAQSNRFFIGATATIRGDVRLHQGMTIRISGVSSIDDGYWWVISAKHTITLADYSTDVTLARDSVDAPTASPDITGPRSSLLGRPVVVDNTTSPSLVATAPATIYDPAATTPPVVPVPTRVQQVANFAPRPVPGPLQTTITQAGVTKIDLARLHAWRAVTSSVRVSP